MSKKEKYLLYITIIFVSCAVFNKMALRPVIGKSTALNRQIQLERQMVENSLYLLNQKEDIQREYRKYTDYAKQKLSEEEETVSFLKEIEDIAKKSSVQLVDLKLYVPKRKDFYIEYRIEVETEAEMNQLITFIHNLQSSKSLLRVTKFRISPKVDKPDILKTNLTITKVFIP